MIRGIPLLTMLILSLPCLGAPSPLLRESWTAYVQRFVQDDGRVVDHQAHGISTSEGQAYAMLRAVWIDDRAIFDKVHGWALNNLNRGVRQDHLWAWKWGPGKEGKWQVLDTAFATDADQDAALALILASERWGDSAYLTAAQAMLGDLWNKAIRSRGNSRYLLAGDSLCKGAVCRLNPSYYAPYAYRIFSFCDKAHPWNEMVAASYEFLDQVSRLTRTRLPPDWVELDTVSGAVSLGSDKDSVFSYDAFRTFWRVALDYELTTDPDAALYLKNNLAWLARLWREDGSLPASISAEGKPRARYQSYEMLAAALAGMQLANPQVAAAMEKNLQSIYHKGIWGENDGYYLQNWAWFGLALYRHDLGPLARYITR